MRKSEGGNMKGIEKMIVLMAILGLATAVFVHAAPTGVDEISVGESSRFNTSVTTPTQVFAQAGNVTELSINATGVTTSWQGYYGNVTGTLVLADSSGNNFYDWNVSIPSGEVYASRNDTVTWTAINCTNTTEVSQEETYLGQTATDPDSVTNTYSLTSHPSFLVGTANMTGCYSTHAYDNESGQATGFWQVLLSDTAEHTVYTTILDSSVLTGFNNRPWNFELLVGENGKAGNEGTTPYYFYVELQ
jgi:hypothetical protein